MPAKGYRAQWFLDNEAEIRRLAEEGLTARKICFRLGLHVKAGALLRQMRNSAIPVASPGVGENSRHWKGGRVEGRDGYIQVYAPDHPMAKNGKYVLKHRLVAEQALGRLLEPTEVVHHIDGDRGNNQPDNLVLFSSNAAHREYEGQIALWAKRQYGRQHVRSVGLSTLQELETCDEEQR